MSLPAQTKFEDVTAAAGMEYSGESWGASWGDLDGDGWPDLFVNHHRAKPALYLNQGNGTVVDIIASTYWGDPRNVGDMHGGGWGDFDNDGDQDLYVAHGSKNKNHFMVNEGGELVYRTPQYDPEYPSWRGRLPIWFDFSHDGLLDYLVTSENRVPILEQAGNGFVDRTNLAGIKCDGMQMGFLADVNADNTLDLICSGAAFPGRIYDFRLGVPFTEVTGQMPKTGSTQDVAIADFDGDLQSDFFMVRGAKRLSGADKIGNNKVQAQLITIGGGEKSARFVSDGDVTFTLVVERAFAAADVSIGASGWHPNVSVSRSGGERKMVLTLSSSDPSVVGIATHNPRNSRDVYIGYDPGSRTWTLVNSPGGLWTFLAASMTSTAAVSNVSATGINSLDRPIEPRLILHKNSGFADVTGASGLRENILCVSTAAADFDNDMDVDLYAVCRGAILNEANLYFDNDGAGNFVQVPLAGGAVGPVGSGVGKGENVVTADYDLDGNVDLFVTNGLALNPERVGGPDLLFRNLGTGSNQWIELDLVGTVSNRDGIGARVVASAGGRKQLREQSGGYHRWSQHDKRLHFGLAKNTSVNLVIEWPSGIIDTHNNVSAGAIYTVEEGGAISQLMPGQGAARTVSLRPSTLRIDENDGPAVINVDLSRQASNPVTVNYRTRDGSATAPDDYQSRNSSIVFNAGQTSKTISIPIVNDAVAEALQSFTVELTSVVGNANLGQSTATVEINDDDTASGLPEISIGDALAEESPGGSVLTFAVTLDKPNPAASVTVQYATANRTAMAGGDYIWENGSVVFLPGEVTSSIDVSVVNDDQPEDVEVVAVELSNASNGVIGAAHTGIGTITDDDSTAQPVTDWVGHSGGVTTSGNRLNYSGSPLGWLENTVNSVPLSSLGAGSDFEVSWRLNSDPAGTIWVMGLGVMEINAGRSDVDYGLRSSNGRLTVYESGLWRTNGPMLAAGDVISIRVTSPGLIEYLHNDETFYASSFAGSPDFYIDTSFKEGAASFFVSLQGNALPGPPGNPGDPVAITDWFNHLGGVTTNGNNVSFSNGLPGWENTVNSVPLSALGMYDNYELRWEVTTEPVGNWMVGLGVEETGFNWRDVEFGFRLHQGLLKVYENGDEQYNAGPLVSGDQLTIRITGTTLQYRRNGELLYSRPLAGNEDFYIDTSFKDGQAEMLNYTVVPL